MHSLFSRRRRRMRLWRESEAYRVRQRGYARAWRLRQSNGVKEKVKAKVVDQDLVAEAIVKLEQASKRLEAITYNAKAEGALSDVHAALSELKAFNLDREAMK